MLPQLVLFFSCFTVITGKPALEQFREDIENAIQRLESLEGLDEILLNLAQQSTKIQNLATTMTQNVHSSLASLPEECSADRPGDIETEKNKLLVNVYKCNVFQIVGDVVNISVDSALYIYDVFSDSSMIIADLVACTNAGFNPFTFVYCIYKAVVEIPPEIRDIIALTKQFESNWDVLVPRINQGIESCFNKTCHVYIDHMNDVIAKANECNRGKLL